MATDTSLHRDVIDSLIRRPLMAAGQASIQSDPRLGGTSPEGKKSHFRICTGMPPAMSAWSAEQIGSK